MAHLIARGIAATATTDETGHAIAQTFIEATDNLSWLRRGQTVLLKPALNSPDPYPATTHPQTVQIITQILKERGANVLIADQSGIEHVLHSPTGVLRGSSLRNFQRSGMGNPEELPFVAVEDRGWEKGFYRVSTPRTSAWQDGFYLTTLVQSADHIINLPRLSTHAQAGVTLGFKNWVGWLREDSRMTFHTNGPFNGFIASAGRRAKLDIPKDGRSQFIEKIVEVSTAIQDKLRLTLFTGTKAQVTIGPDRRVAGVPSAIVTPSTGLVFASTDPVATEAFAIAFLTLLSKQAPAHQRFLQKILMRINGQAQELGTTPVAQHPFITHAVKLGLGVPGAEVSWDNVPDSLRSDLQTLLFS